MKRLIIVMAALLAWPAAPAARALDEPLGAFGSGGTAQVTAMLFADASTCQAGAPFNVGVLFSIKPGWHIYWENPGDGGIGTRVKFTVPAGYTISPPRFSVPRTFIMPGDIRNFGYEESALVMATVTPSAGARGSARIDVSADWLACNPKECTPGNATMNVTIPVGKAAQDAGGAAILKQWADRMPAADSTGSPQADGPVKSIAWVDRPAVGKLPWDGAFSFTVEWKKTPNVVEWYPNPGENVLVKDVTVTTRGLTTTVKFTVNANVQADVKSIPFPSVLAYEDDSGRRGVIVDVKPAGLAGAAATGSGATTGPAGSASGSGGK
jgi:hypothetical protein